MSRKLISWPPKPYILFILVLFLILATDKYSFAEDEKVTVSYCEYHITHKFAVESVREAYRRIGLSAVFKARPCRRSLIEANAGVYDAEVARVPGTNKDYLNLLQIRFPTISIEGVVITQSIKKKIKNWKDLAGLQVGIIRGEIYAEKGTAGYKVHVASSYNQLLKMLLRGRIDVGIVIRRDWELVMKSASFIGQDIHVIGQPVFSASLHHLVHEKNKTLMKKLNKVFQDMWENGAANDIHQRTMGALTGK